MKVFVSTKETQGQRKNDFCHVPEGEIVSFGSECDREEPDGRCGCMRSLIGVKSATGTTTFKVVDMNLTPQLLTQILEASLVDHKWYPSYEKAHPVAADAALELIHLTNAFPVGAIVERRGNKLQQRTRRKR